MAALHFDPHYYEHVNNAYSESGKTLDEIMKNSPGGVIGLWSGRNYKTMKPCLSCGAPYEPICSYCKTVAQ